MPKPRPEHNIPKYIIRDLVSSFHNFSSDHDYGFPVWNDTLNMWLTNKLGLHTDSPRFDIAGMSVFFDWRLQIWRVR